MEQIFKIFIAIQDKSDIEHNMCHQECQILNTEQTNVKNILSINISFFFRFCIIYFTNSTNKRSCTIPFDLTHELISCHASGKFGYCISNFEIKHSLFVTICVSKKKNYNLKNKLKNKVDMAPFCILILCKFQSVFKK